MADRDPYATPEDFARFGLGAAAFEGVTTEDVLAHLRVASDKLDLWIEGVGGYLTPLTAWGEDVTCATCEVAALSLRGGQLGFDPEGRDRFYVERADKAQDHILYLAAVGSSKLTGAT